MQNMSLRDYRKSSSKPPGEAYSIWRRHGGPIREGGLSTKSNEKDIYDRISVFYPHILRNQHIIIRVEYINSIKFNPIPFQN